MNEGEYALPPILRGKRVHDSLPDVRPARNNQPVYVKHAFPELFRENRDYYHYLPTLPHLPGEEGAAEEQYGLMYHTPETEAEIKMHDLWIAKRREEAFHWKAQQQLTLVLDRMALHRSQLESDMLRRHEVSEYLRGTSTERKSSSLRSIMPGGSPDRSTVQSAAAGDLGNSTSTKKSEKGSPNRFAPIIDPNARKKRILSGRIDARINTGKYEYDTDEDNADIYEDNSSDSEQSVASPAEYREESTLKGVTKVEVGNKTLIQSERKDVKKSKKALRPFRFSSELPLTYKEEFYMELSSDSENDDDYNRDNKSGGTSRGRNRSTEPGFSPKASKKKPVDKKTPGGTVAGVKIMFKHDKPTNRERPISPTLFKTLSEADPETKVLYRHTNFRRMPLTARQEKWLEDRESERVKMSMEFAKKLVDAEAEKAAKIKEKSSKEGGKGSKDGKDNEKDKKKKEAKAAKEEEERKAKAKPPKPKYKSASQFMLQHFPQFDGDEEEDRIEACGPMKVLQMAEVEKVLDAFAHVKMKVDHAIVKRALIVPQDHPDAICLEMYRNSSTEGLMVNPLPPELWKKSGHTGKKKGGGGGGGGGEGKKKKKK